MNKRGLGKAYETTAACFLQNAGYTILERNYNCKFGEIDIIALEGQTLVFAEVKYRQDTQSGWPEEAVNRSKQRKICLSADYYCLEHSVPDNQDCRFDVIAIDNGELRHYPNAFLYCGNHY